MRLVIILLLSAGFWASSCCQPQKIEAPNPVFENPDKNPRNFVERTGIFIRSGEENKDKIFNIPYVQRAYEPVLLVLGGPFCIEWFGRYLEEDYNVIYFEPSPNSLLLSEKIADVEELVNTLKLDQIILFGHSDSGAVVMEYAAKHKEQVSKIIWVSGLNDHPRSLQLEFQLLEEHATAETEKMLFNSLSKKEEFTLLDVVLSLQSRKLSPTCTNAEVCRRFFERSKAAVNELGYLKELKNAYSDPPVPADRLLAMITPDLRNRSFLQYRSAEISADLQQIPILMIQGELDETVHPDTTKAFAATLPKAKLVMFEDSGHLPFMDENQKFIKEVRLFLGIDLQTPPSPSALAVDWTPDYDDGNKSTEQLEAEAIGFLEKRNSGMADGLLKATCGFFGEIPSDDLLVRFNLKAVDHMQFYSLFCKNN